jgi:hypothetical protein
MGHKTCTWDSDGKPEGGNLLEDAGVHGGYIRMDPQETGKDFELKWLMIR